MRATGSPAQKDVRKGRRGRRTLLVTLAFFVGFLVIDGLVGDRGLVVLMRARQQDAQLSAEVAMARAENDRLRERVRLLSEDPATIEEIARRDLGLIRPGERMFIIRDVPGPAQR